jgi:hypothetical protein
MLVTQSARENDWYLWFGGQYTTGVVEMLSGCVSFTVTLNGQLAVFPEPSVAWQVAVVLPTGNLEPDGGLQVVAVTLQLSVAAAA